MSAAVAEHGPRTEAPESTTPLVRFDPNEAAIALLKEQYAGLPARATTREGRDECHAALQVMVKHRTAVDKRRKELNDDAIKWQRRVNAEAGHLIGSILEVETPLRNARDAWDNEKKRIAQTAEDAERARLAKVEQDRIDAENAKREALWAAKEAELLGIRQAQEAAAKVENDRLAKIAADLAEQRKRDQEAQAAAQKKLDDQRRADDAKRLADRRRLDAENAAQQEALSKQQAEVDRQARAVQAEKDRLAAEQREREEQARREREAAEQAERENQERLEREVAEQQARQAEWARLEALKPDVEKINAFGATIRQMPALEMTTVEGADFMLGVILGLALLAERCEKFPGDVIPF